jgi:hypothetical protein
MHPLFASPKNPDMFIVEIIALLGLNIGLLFVKATPFRNNYN